MSNEFLCEFCCPIVRVHVVGNNCRLNPETVLEIFKCLFKKLYSLIILQISNMLAYDCIMPFCKCKSILQFSTASKNFWHFHSEFNRVGDISPCSSDDSFCIFIVSYNRIIHPHINVPVMKKKKVCNI